MRLRVFGAAFAASAAAVLAPAVTPAHAAPGTAARHCVVDVRSPSAATCYASFTSALAKATAGKVSTATASVADLDAKVNAANAANAKARTAVAQASIVIGIEYAGDDYTGSSLIYSAGYGCDDDISVRDWYVNVLPNGWNDDIESFRTYAGCAAMHYIDIYQGGAHVGWWYSWGSIGGIEDEVSSIEWT
jgi:hypothetical protein